MSDAASEGSDAQKHTASQCNNAAWDLIEKSDLSTDERVALVKLAGTAAYHWHTVGTETNIAHAHVLFAWALARAGAAVLAIDSAERALKYFTKNPSKDWERAFAHAAMAAAFHSAGDQEGYNRHYEAARQLESKLAVGELKLFQAAFRTVPRP